MEDLRAIVNSLGPTDQLHWDIALYVLFALNLGILLLLPPGSTMGTFLSILVLIGLVIDKTFAFGYIFDPGPYTPETCHAKIFFGTYLVRAIMFAAPLSIAGSTKEGRVRSVGILAGLGGAVYSFARWYADQREVEAPEITCFNTEVMVQSAGLVLLLAQITLRRRLRLGTVHRDVPVAILRAPAAHDVEV